MRDVCKLKEKKLSKSTIVLLILIAWTVVVWNSELFAYLDTSIFGEHYIGLGSNSVGEGIHFLTLMFIWWFSPGIIIMICALMLVDLYKKHEKKYKKIIIAAILILNIAYYLLFYYMGFAPSISGLVKQLIQ